MLLEGALERPPVDTGDAPCEQIYLDALARKNLPYLGIKRVGTQGAHRRQPLGHHAGVDGAACDGPCVVGDEGLLIRNPVRQWDGAHDIAGKRDRPRVAENQSEPSVNDTLAPESFDVNRGCDPARSNGPFISRSVEASIKLKCPSRPWPKHADGNPILPTGLILSLFIWTLLKSHPLFFVYKRKGRSRMNKQSP